MNLPKKLLVLPCPQVDLNSNVNAGGKALLSREMEHVEVNPALLVGVWIQQLLQDHSQESPVSEEDCSLECKEMESYCLYYVVMVGGRGFLW